MIVDLVTYRDITGDTFTADDKVLRMLARAQGKAEEITGRLFDRLERTESLPVDDQGKVWPSAYPIADPVASPSSATVTDDGMSIRVSDGAAWWAGLPTGWSLSERPRYAVTYTGGYDGIVTPPTSLVDAICELAHRYCNPADTTTVPAGATSLGASGQSVAGPRLGGSASVPPALRAELLKFQHIAGRLS